MRVRRRLIERVGLTGKSENGHPDAGGCVCVQREMRGGNVFFRVSTNPDLGPTVVLVIEVDIIFTSIRKKGVQVN